MKTKSIKMQNCLDQISQVAKTDYPIVLQGETGTGKSMIAKEIYRLSLRADKPFIALDISVIPETLIESELFGYEKGAFTGADKKRTGYFERAHSGTIFIDELENMNPYVQSKLLNVIEERQVYPVGSTKAIDIDIRIISATNTNIIQLVQQKKFREDLYYRLVVIVIDIPALRDRIEDLPYLANKFLKEACRELKRDIKSIPENVMDYLSGYPYPGNIRELKNIMQRAALFSGYNDEISVENIGNLMYTEPIIDSELEFDPPIMPLKDLIENTECAVIKKALKKTNNNKTKASKLLNITYKTLFNKLHLYNLIELTATILLMLTFITDINDNFRQTRSNCRVKTRTSQRAKKEKK